MGVWGGYCFHRVRDSRASSVTTSLLRSSRTVSGGGHSGFMRHVSIVFGLRAVPCFPACVVAPRAGYAAHAREPRVDDTSGGPARGADEFAWAARGDTAGEPVRAQSSRCLPRGWPPTSRPRLFRKFSSLSHWHMVRPQILLCSGRVWVADTALDWAGSTDVVESAKPCNKLPSMPRSRTSAPRKLETHSCRPSVSSRRSPASSLSNRAGSAVHPSRVCASRRLLPQVFASQMAQLSALQQTLMSQAAEGRSKSPRRSGDRPLRGAERGGPLAVACEPHRTGTPLRVNLSLLAGE